MPSSNHEFATYCCDLLGAIGPCVLRRMFGGYGISIDGLTVAIMTNLGQGEKLWLKADDESRALFEAAGCQRFTYQPNEGPARSMNYYTVPEDAMDSPPLMAPWARLALDAAVKADAKTALKVAKKSPTKASGKSIVAAPKKAPKKAPKAAPKEALKPAQTAVKSIKKK